MQPLSGRPGFHTRKDETGKVYGRLTVVSFDSVDANGNARWNCHCECGNDVLVRGYTLRQNQQVSCGCYQAELCSQLMAKRWAEYRNQCIRALFTDGLYPMGPKPSMVIGRQKGSKNK